ncbi:MAG: GNAT family N-acetyltransferase [Undibacterium sp.]|nr:GNAT family N-acetyltransferase [Opitutaceae bacterium]
MNTDDGKINRGVVIEALGAVPSARDGAELADLLTACVEGGASIGFLAPLPRAEADAYWGKIAGDLSGGFRVLLVARDRVGGKIIGSAQVMCEAKANGRHRGEVQKVMVHPAYRRRRIAARLMAEIERIAVTRGLTLLFLDTSDSHAGARVFYERLAYVYAGGIPNYALDPHGTPEKNAIFYKVLAAN